MKNKIFNFFALLALAFFALCETTNAQTPTCDQPNNLTVSGGIDRERNQFQRAEVVINVKAIRNGTLQTIASGTLGIFMEYYSFDLSNVAYSCEDVLVEPVATDYIFYPSSSPTALGYSQNKYPGTYSQQNNVWFEAIRQ